MPILSLTSEGQRQAPKGLKKLFAQSIQILW